LETEEAEEEEAEEEATGYRIKNQNPTQRCGKKTKYDKQNSLSSLQASSSFNIVHTKAPTHTYSFHLIFLSLSLSLLFL